MRTKPDPQSEAPRLAWKVAKVPEGETSLKVGGVRAAIGGEVRLTQEQADTLNKAVPGCLSLQGI